MAAIGAIPQDAISGFTVLGELGHDGGKGSRDQPSLEYRQGDKVIFDISVGRAVLCNLRIAKRPLGLGVAGRL